MRKVLVAGIIGLGFLAGCGGEYDPTVVVDNSQVSDMKKYNSDLEQCKGLAKTIDLHQKLQRRPSLGRRLVAWLLQVWLRQSLALCFSQRFHLS